jgi:hypothetical protein
MSGVSGATAAVRMISAWSGVRKESNQTAHWGEEKKEHLIRDEVHDEGMKVSS